MNENSDLFIITSVINTGQVSWSYCPKRSLFSPEERFKQTLETIESIRKYAPNGRILLVEGGKLENIMLDKFFELCEYVEYLGEDTETQINCIQTRCKGLGDSWLIYKGLEYIKRNNIICRNIYKMSGRYRINENYDTNMISNDLPSFKRVTDNCHCTFFFSVPYKLLEMFIHIIQNIISVMKSRTDIGLEQILPNSFTNKLVLETIGAEGTIAVDYSYSVYRV